MFGFPVPATQSTLIHVTKSLHAPDSWGLHSAAITKNDDAIPKT